MSTNLIYIWTGSCLVAEASANPTSELILILVQFLFINKSWNTVNLCTTNCPCLVAEMSANPTSELILILVQFLFINKSWNTVNLCTTTCPCLVAEASANPIYAAPFHFPQTTLKVKQHRQGWCDIQLVSWKRFLPYTLSLWEISIYRQCTGSWWNRLKEIKVANLYLYLEPAQCNVDKV